jgi:plastocyanin
MKAGQILRIVGALALLVAGLVHLDIYFSGYRSAGSVPSFGRSIFLTAIAFGIVAVAVAARREWPARAAGIAVSAATLLAFMVTHNGRELFGFEGTGLDPSPQALIALLAEIAAIVVLAVTFVPGLAEGDASSGPAVLAGAAVLTAIVFVAFGIYWADKYETPDVVAAPSSVAIADFRFSPDAVTVAAGTPVTWTNNDSVGHSVVAEDESFSSDSLDQGATFQVTFEAPGDYPYVCGIHPTMTGTITVTD